MHVLLLAAAAALAVTVPATPAMAQSGSSQGLSASHQVKVHRSHGHLRGDSGDRDHRRFDRRRHSDSGDVVFGNYGSYGEWGRYNNRSFDPDSFNDWWHERTWRSYPRWVMNPTCDSMGRDGRTSRCSY